MHVPNYLSHIGYPRYTVPMPGCLFPYMPNNHRLQLLYIARRGSHILRWALRSSTAHPMEWLVRKWLQLGGAQGLARVKLPQLWAKPFIYLVPLDFRERIHYATGVQNICSMVCSGSLQTQGHQRPGGNNSMSLMTEMENGICSGVFKG